MLMPSEEVPEGCQRYMAIQHRFLIGSKRI
jgi:hypothetical protein